jgi:hypothetical protein
MLINNINLKSPIFTLFLTQFKIIKIIDYFNNKNRLLKYNLSILKVPFQNRRLNVKIYLSTKVIII